MPISATGTWKTERLSGNRLIYRDDRRSWTASKRFRRGFTLLEIMVTLTIVAILTGFAVLSLPDQTADEKTYLEAKRLVALLQLNQEEAVLLGEQRGVVFSRDGYAFRVWRNERWSTPQDFEQLNAYRLPDSMELTLDVEGQTVALEQKLPPELEIVKPQVVLLASGESSDFSVAIDERYRISADGLGTPVLQAISQ